MSTEPMERHQGRLDWQAYNSLLKHAEQCDSDPDYDWDEVLKDRRHAMNAAVDLKAAKDKLAQSEAMDAEILQVLKTAERRIYQHASWHCPDSHSLGEALKEVSSVIARLEEMVVPHDEVDAQARQG